MTEPFFQYYVFSSGAEAPTPAERSAGVYLRESAESRYLQQFLDPLYEAHRVGISTSDDEVISGPALEALAAAIRDACSAVESQPAEWLVTVGYRFEPYETEPGPAIVRTASKSSIQAFLLAAEAHLKNAVANKGFLHWGGGG